MNNFKDPKYGLELFEDEKGRCSVIMITEFSTGERVKSVKFTGSRSSAEPVYEATLLQMVNEGKIPVNYTDPKS